MILSCFQKYEPIDNVIIINTVEEQGSEWGGFVLTLKKFFKTQINRNFNLVSKEFGSFKNRITMINQNSKSEIMTEVNDKVDDIKTTVNDQVDDVRNELQTVRDEIQSVNDKVQDIKIFLQQMLDKK